MTVRARAHPFYLIPLLALLGACDFAPQGTLAELATDWSGGNTTPVCKDQLPRGAALTHGTQYCEWVLAAHDQPAAVNGFRFQGRLGSVTWVHLVNDSATASRFTDSLGAALEARGLSRRSCGKTSTHDGIGQGYRWESSSLAVQLTRHPGTGGERELIVSAVDTPRAMSAALCAPQ
jgi:hypothetical protein